MTQRHYDFKNPNVDSKTEESGVRSNKRRYILTGNNYKSVVEEQIQEAIERGDFDNLPGKGKPLDIEDNPFARDMQMAYKLLKDNNFTLPWIEERNRMLEEMVKLRERNAHQFQLFAPQIQAMARGGQIEIAKRRWTALLMQWETAMEELNKRIADVNRMLPTMELELYKLNLDVELTRLGTTREMVNEMIA
jgi:DnaJ family protein C protein 28